MAIDILTLMVDSIIIVSKKTAWIIIDKFIRPLAMIGCYFISYDYRCKHEQNIFIFFTTSRAVLLKKSYNQIYA